MNASNLDDALFAGCTAPVISRARQLAAKGWGPQFARTLLPAQRAVAASHWWPGQ